MKKLMIGTWAAQIIAAVILLQSLFFKFTGAKISVELFTLLGVEPWGRIFTGVLELIAGVMLFIPVTALYGAALAFVIMVGAILSHLFVIGVSFGGDVSLFILAIVVLLLSGFVIYVRKKKFV